MKGNSSCHIPNDKYRDGWDRIFGKKEKAEQVVDDAFAFGVGITKGGERIDPQDFFDLPESVNE